MRPQMKLFLATALVLIATTVASAEPFLSPSPIRDQMHKALRCQNNDAEDFRCQQQSDSRLASHVLQLSYGALLSVPSLREDAFPEQQLRCQKAIVRGSISYVSRWVEAIERGRTPELADHFASRQLEAVSAACNVPVLQNPNGVTMPAAGGPCAFWTNEPYATVDAEALRVCLHRTLEFWTSYLYIPVQQ